MSNVYDISLDVYTSEKIETRVNEFSNFSFDITSDHWDKEGTHFICKYLEFLEPTISSFSDLLYVYIVFPLKYILIHKT